MLHHKWHFLLSLNILLIFIPSFAQPINPEPGENLWHILAAVGTELDLLAIDQAECCAGTFTVLHDIQETLCSKINMLDAPLDNCCFTINSKIENLAQNADECCQTLLSKIDVLNLCQSTPIEINPNGTTIATAGSYTLINEVSLDAGSNVTINANDVFFDLNNHRIRGGQGIIIAPSNNRITVKNGYVVSSATSGIMLLGANEDIHLNNIDITSTSMGITCTNQTNILMRNLNISNVDFGILATSCNNSSIQNCSIVGKSNGSSTYGIGFNIGLETIANDCWTVQQTTVDSFASGFNLTNVSSIVMRDCTACNNVSSAPTSAGFIIQDTSSSFSQKHTLIRCASNVNSSHGFLITNGSAIGSSFSLENCIALGKDATNSGVGNGFEVSRPNGIFNQCQSSLMNIGFNILSGATNCVFNNCSSANQTSHGFFLLGASTSCTECVATNNGANGFRMSNTPLSATYSCDLLSCRALYNTAQGFFVEQDANKVALQKCIASGNVLQGFIFGTAAGQSITGLAFSECIASNNSATGFDLANVVNVQSNTTVERCTAVGNGIGSATAFGFRGNAAGASSIAFYLNTAHTNGNAVANNYNNTGTTSPTPLALNSVTRLYGDNLTSI